MHNIPILYYHSIAPAVHSTWIRNYLTLEVKYFEEHLRYFRRNGYEFLFIKDLLNTEKIKEKKKQVVISFDDGYLDNYVYVFPLLKKYDAKATIFVNPVFADNNPERRSSSEWGFLSWDEMRLMEESGLVDIQSHTLTHQKYPVSDRLERFHHPGNDILYTAADLCIERLPYYINDIEFEKIIPYGYPLFEEKSSAVARKVIINRNFIETVVEKLKYHNWSEKYTNESVFTKIEPVYKDFLMRNEVIIFKESEVEYRERVKYELEESKRIIEKKLNKIVEICCWPHGDSNEYSHKAALEAGYKATTSGNYNGVQGKDRIPERMGLSPMANSVFLTRLKINYKVKSYEGIQPYKAFNSIYDLIRYGTF
jgi:hypothetical protein